MKLTILAAGAWGTALAIAFSSRHAVTLWSRETEVAEDIQNHRENSRFLPGHRLPETIQITSDLNKALSATDLILIATPIAGLRAMLEAAGKQAAGQPVLWVCKGFEAGTGQLPHQIAAACLTADTAYGVLSGPSFAQEVAAGKPTALSLAGSSNAPVDAWATALHGQRLRIYAGDDMVGVEIGGAIKNVMAIATGICDGLQLGLNARAALITRGLAEMARLGEALGARRETLMGLAGIGDLILTCTGDLSRNRQVGLKLAEGHALTDILAALGHVAEGVPTATEVARIAIKLKVDMPISSAVADILEGKIGASAAVDALLARNPRSEQA